MRSVSDSLATSRFILHSEMARLGHLSPCRIRHRIAQNSELVVEGFPRSANTWVRVALQECNPGILITSHTHCGVTLRLAARSGIAALALVRRPRDACASLLVREPHLTPYAALRRYVLIYKEVDGTAVLTIPFEEATLDLSRTVSELRRRWPYLRDLRAPNLNDARTIDRIHQAVDEADMADREAHEVDLRTVARPLQGRHAALRLARERLAEECPSGLREAERVYGEMMSRR